MYQIGCGDLSANYGVRNPVLISHCLLQPFSGKYTQHPVKYFNSKSVHSSAVLCNFRLSGVLTLAHIPTGLRS
jgi:hypothetical protein